MRKISELSTKEGIKVLGRLTVEFNDLASDEKFKKLCADAAENKKMTGFEQIGLWADVLLNQYPHKVINILACIAGVESAEIEKQPLTKTIKQFQGIFKDPDLIAFFTSFSGLGGKK